MYGSPNYAQTTAPAATPASREAAVGEAIRPFRVRVPEADLADLRRHLDVQGLQVAE